MLVPWFVTWDAPGKTGGCDAKHAIWMGFSEMERMHDATLKSLYSMDLRNSQRLWFVSFVVKVTRHVFFKVLLVSERMNRNLRDCALPHGVDEHGPFLLNWGYHINSILNLMSLIIQSGQVRIGFPTRRLSHSLTYHKSVTYYILHNTKNQKETSQPLQCIILKAMIINIISRSTVPGVLHDLATVILRRHTAPSFTRFQGPVLVLAVTSGWKV